MKLNKFQYAWIKKLKSGTTRKTTGQLRKSNCFCCLGVGIKSCEPKTSINDYDGTLEGFVDVKNNLNIDNVGTILTSKISDKWKKKLKDSKITWYEAISLTVLNDETDMTHIDIGKFIDENREAVFHDNLG